MFNQQIEKTIDVYLDDMLVKNMKAAEHLVHLD